MPTHIGSRAIRRWLPASRTSCRRRCARRLLGVRRNHPRARTRPSRFHHLRCPQRSGSDFPSSPSAPPARCCSSGGRAIEAQRPFRTAFSLSPIWLRCLRSSAREPHLRPTMPAKPITALAYTLQTSRRHIPSASPKPRGEVRSSYRPRDASPDTVTLISYSTEFTQQRPQRASESTLFYLLLRRRWRVGLAARGNRGAAGVRLQLRRCHCVLRRPRCWLWPPLGARGWPQRLLWSAASIMLLVLCHLDRTLPTNAGPCQAVAQLLRARFASSRPIGYHGAHAAHAHQRIHRARHADLWHQKLAEKTPTSYYAQGLRRGHCAGFCCEQSSAQYRRHRPRRDLLYAGRGAPVLDKLTHVS